MNLLRDCVLPVALGLILAPAAWAGDDDKKASASKGDEQTIKGVVAEVTLVGETDIDNKTGKAVTSQGTFLTIIGHPWNHEAMKAEKEREHASNDKDREVKRTSTDESKSAGSHKRRMNVYVVAVTPKTKMCECTASGKEGSAAKEEKCELDKLEIGDRVEVCFSPKDSEKDSRAEMQKHGRHRIYFGVASDLKILDEPMESERPASSESKDKK